MEVLYEVELVRYAKQEQADIVQVQANLNHDADCWLTMAQGAETPESTQRKVRIETMPVLSDSGVLLGRFLQASLVLTYYPSPRRIEIFQFEEFSPVGEPGYILYMKRRDLKLKALNWLSEHDPNRPGVKLPYLKVAETSGEEELLIKLNRVRRFILTIAYLDLTEAQT